jgi:anti-sigma regulatory factor (Ser/Thr protein kinase)
LLAATIFQIITEKRIQLRLNSQVSIDFEVNSENYGLFGNIHLTEFKRMLSNLIGNSIEAMNGNGTILIKLLHEDEFIKLIISDNGKGIPREILDKLGNYGMSHDKKNGSGLGVYHAKNTIEKLSGRLSIVSELNKGTDVTLTIPKSYAPLWFLPKLEIYPNTTLIILDDDLSIHHLWRERFNYCTQDINIINFTSPEKFQEWQEKNCNKLDRILYFFDLEFLGYYQTGVKLIEKYQLQDNSILITSHFEEKDIRERCEKLRIKMIPKDLAVFIPIIIQL